MTQSCPPQNSNSLLNNSFWNCPLLTEGCSRAVDSLILLPACYSLNLFLWPEKASRLRLTGIATGYHCCAPRNATAGDQCAGHHRVCSRDPPWQQSQCGESSWKGGEGRSPGPMAGPVQGLSFIWTNFLLLCEDGLRLASASCPEKILMGAQHFTPFYRYLNTYLPTFLLGNTLYKWTYFLHNTCHNICSFKEILVKWVNKH